MTTTFERKPKCRAVVRAEIPADEAETLRREVLQDFVKQVKLPGFRKGKTPRRLLEQRFGKQVTQEMERKLADRIVGQLEGDGELAVMQTIQISGSQPHPDGSWSMVLEVLTAPTFELPDYTGIPIHVPGTAVEDSEVEEALEKRRLEHADYVDEPAGTALAPGLFAVIDFEGFIDGLPLADRLPQEARYFASRADAWLKVEEGVLLPGFYEGLLGHRAGETVPVQTTMPDDFAIEDLRGLQVEYTVVIKGVKSERLPSLESLAGGSEEGVAALRELVKTEMLLERTRVRARALDSELLSFLHRAVDFELPPEMVRAYAQRSVNDLVRENQSMGVSDEIIRGQEEAIVEAAGHRARRELKTEFILSEISRREGIALTNEELREAVNDIAKSVGFSYSKTMQRLVQNRRIREVGTKRLFRKVLDFLIDRAKIVEEEPNETAPPSAS